MVVRDNRGHAAGGFHKEDFRLADHGMPRYSSRFALDGGAAFKPAAKAQGQLDVPGEPAASPTRLRSYLAPKAALEFAPDRLQPNTLHLMISMRSVKLHRSGWSRVRITGNFV
jgi:hypothetical protein